MKHINPWKVFLLPVVTFGVYSYVWMAKRRREMIDTYGQSIPHWWWLVVSSIVLTVLLAGLMTLAVIDVTSFMTAITIISLAFLMLLLPIVAIYVWWFWRFSKAAAYVTHGRVPAGWGLALTIGAGSLATVFWQYYFNRAEPAEKLADTPKASPSKRFKFAAVAVIVGITASSVLAPFPGMAELDKASQVYDERVQQADDENKKAERLAREYGVCVEQLDERFPEVTDETETMYMQAYDDCESIRIEQNKAADTYNRLLLSE